MYPTTYNLTRAEAEKTQTKVAGKQTQKQDWDCDGSLAVF